MPKQTKAPEKHTDKHEAFCQEYLVDLNGKQAAIRAGYSASTAEAQASRLLRNVKVKERIQKLMDERAVKVGVTAERVLTEIERMAFLDVAEIASAEVKGPEDIAKLPEDVRRAITGWKWDRAGRFVLTFADKARALEMYGRHLKLFTDKVEHTGKDGSPLEFRNLSDDQLDAKLNAALAKAGIAGAATGKRAPKAKP